MSYHVNPYLALVGSSDVLSIAGDRIYPDVAPQSAEAPFIVWQLISNTPYNSLCCIPDSDRQRVQIDAYAADPVVCRDLVFAARDVMQVAGTVDAGPAPLPMEKDTRLYRWTLDALCHHKRGA